MADRAIRLEDLARLAGVSTATVSRALNDSPLVKEETKRAVRALARKHNYPFRRAALSGPIGASQTLALVIPAPQGREGRLSDAFYLSLVGGIGDAARDRGCDFLVSHVSPTPSTDLIELLESSRAEGVIFMGQSLLHDKLNALVEENARFVVWGAELPGQRYVSVGSDNLRGAQRATSHLARLGRKRIAYLGDTDTPEPQQRYLGYREALRDLGLPFDEALVRPAHFDMESAGGAIETLMARGVEFDAVFAASDMIAIGAIRTLIQRGVRVPDDVSVAGYDDVPIASYYHPALTTIRQDTLKAGTLLVSKLLTLIGGGRAVSERLPTELVVRESCGA